MIDSDLRSPCATDYLGIDVPVGLSEVLGGQLKLEDAIVRLEPAGLICCPAEAARRRCGIACPVRATPVC